MMFDMDMCRIFRYCKVDCEIKSVGFRIFFFDGNC